MIGIIATVRVRENQNESFEKTARKLVAAVNADEPGNLFYQLYRMGEGEYVFLERYRDRDAVDAHRASAHYKELGRAMREFLAEPPDVKILDEV